MANDAYKHGINKGVEKTLGLSEWLSKIFGPKEEKELLNTVDSHKEMSDATCTLGDRLSGWDRWLKGHRDQVEKQTSLVSADRRRLEALGKDLGSTNKSVIEHAGSIKKTLEKMDELIESVVPAPAPSTEPETDIDVHEQKLRTVQEEHLESLERIAEVLEAESSSMTVQEKELTSEINDVNSKATTLKTIEERLNKEKKATETFEASIAPFLLSNAPPSEEQ